MCQLHVSAGAKVPLAFAMWACPKRAPLCAGTGNFSSSLGGPVYAPVPGGSLSAWGQQLTPGHMDQAACFCCICRLVQL